MSSSLLNCTYECAPHLEGMEVDGEFLIMDSDRLLVTKLGGVGGLLWTLLEKKLPPEALVDRLEAEYDLGGADARRDLAVFLEQLLEKGLIRRAGA